jgi:hypothetical protein
MSDPFDNVFIFGAVQHVSENPILFYGSRIELTSHLSPADADAQCLHSLAYGLGSSPAVGLAQTNRFADSGGFKRRRNTGEKPAPPAEQRNIDL